MPLTEFPGPARGLCLYRPFVSQPNNSYCRGHVARHVRVFLRGPRPSVLGCFWVIRRGSKSSQAAAPRGQRLRAPTFLAGAGGFAFYAD